MKALELLPDRYQLAWRRDPEFLLALTRAHGDALHVRFGPRELLLLHDPAAVGELLIAQHGQFVKGRAHQRARAWLGDGVLISEGAQHLADRRRLQPAFRPAAVAQHAPAIVGRAAGCAASWRPGTARDIARDMHLLALAVIVEFACGADATPVLDQLSQALDVLGAWFSRRATPLSAIADRLPSAHQRATSTTRAWLDTTLGQIISARRQRPPGGDVLGLLLQAEHTRPSDAWLRDQLLTLLLAGRETVAAGLTWAWYVLARYPAAEARLHAELDDALAGQVPCANDLPRLPYTRMVFAEALRLYPPAWATNRRAVSACRLGGHDLAAGAVVLTSQYVLHRSPHAFDDPLAFVPERWAADRARLRPAHSYLPFGAGPRRCLGEPLAWAEGVLAIATLAQRWRLRLPPGAAAVPVGGTSLQPRGGMPMLIERR